ncbi:MAG: hydroxyphenylacetyl-CoA thioesterase PaaI [Desulfosarcina sp.]|nr:hydroxyphenylacetyl-CoA thioesterase PaaI [Desulfobacterales bacterium]
MPTETARQNAIKTHILKDPFVRKMGARFEVIKPGYSRVSLTVTENMANFHGMTHGGLIFALADMAFAAAGNSHGQTAVALNVNISFLKASRPGDKLVAEAKEVQVGGRTAVYEITVREADSGAIIACNQATVYRKKEWFVEPAADDK